jgi:hypothetical protein
MKRGHALAGIALVGLGGVAVLARCSGGEPRASQTAADYAGPDPTPALAEPSGSGAAPSPRALPTSAGSAALLGSGGAPHAAPAASGAVARAGSSAGARIAHALASHPADLTLLTRIERELRLEPPREVHELLRRGAEGAGRDELISLVRALPDLRVRVLALRWVDEVRPPPGGAAPPPVPGAGSGAAPLVKPITPAR